LYNHRILRLVGTQDPFKLFLDLERIKNKWFYAQDTRQISKRKKFTQYVLDTRKLFYRNLIWKYIFIDNNKALLEIIYPKLQGKVYLIRMIINVYRQIQQEAFGIVVINKQNKVRSRGVQRVIFRTLFCPVLLSYILCPVLPCPAILYTLPGSALSCYLIYSARSCPARPILYPTLPCPVLHPNLSCPALFYPVHKKA
jgi:hypothetical protein